MKLTPDQIEIERKKFIESHKDYAGLLMLNKHGRFVNNSMDSRLEGWLACRESCNEIILDITLCGYDSGYKRVYNDEAQGFTVKSQE